MMKSLKNKLVNQLIKHLLSPIDDYHVLAVDKAGNEYLGGKAITNEERKQLRTEAKLLKTLRIWKVLQETIRQKSLEKGMIEATEWEHVLFAKAMLHDLGIMQSIVKQLEKETK